MSNEPTTAENHPFLLDLLAGWVHYAGSKEFSTEYHDLIYALYQKAGVETVAWDDDAPEKKDFTLREQLDWLSSELYELGMNLSKIKGPIYTKPPVEDQDDETPFETPQDCDVILTDKVIHSALVFVTGATSRADAAEKARELAEADEVEWVNSYESVGDVDVSSVKVGKERGR